MRDEGFTLVEVIIAMTILSIVVTILSGVFVTNADMFGFVSGSADDLSELRLAEGRITLELRSIKDRRSIERASESEIVFTDSEGTRTSIEFDRRTSQLVLNGKLLAEDLSSFKMEYLDTKGRDIRTPRVKPETDIWSIVIEMGKKRNSEMKMISRVYPRNFI